MIKVRARKRNTWRWDHIFKVYRCPICGRPTNTRTEYWKKAGAKEILPDKCEYCGMWMEGREQRC